MNVPTPRQLPLVNDYVFTMWQLKYYYYYFYQGEFADEGVETHFEIGNHSAFVRAITTGKKRDGIVHQLFVDEQEIPLAKD